MLLENLRLLNRHVVLAKALRALKMLGRTLMVSRLVERQREIKLLDAPDDFAAGGNVHLLVPHQANVRIIRAMIAQLGIDDERVGVNLDRCGNTSAASIPIALRDAVSAGRLRPGDVLVLNAVGGGMTAGALVARW